MHSKESSFAEDVSCSQDEDSEQEIEDQFKQKELQSDLEIENEKTIYQHMH